MLAVGFVMMSDWYFYDYGFSDWASIGVNDLEVDVCIVVGWYFTG